MSEARTDLHAILDAHPGAASRLLDALNAGRVEGSDYQACLFGVIAERDELTAQRMARQWAADHFGSSGRTGEAESHFFYISRGDTPANNENARSAAEWISEWQAQARIVGAA